MEAGPGIMPAMNGAPPVVILCGGRGTRLRERTQSMPKALEWFADINPFTIVVNAMRHLWVGAPVGENTVIGAFAWSIVLIAVFAPLAVARYRKTTGTR